MTYSAVAWDIDGTLVDSEPLHLRSLLAVSAGLGTDLSDLAHDHFVGVNMNDVWAALKGRYPADLTRTDWITRINAYYAANTHQLVQVPGAAETVRALAARGIAQVAVSNSGRAVVDANLRAIGIADAFAFTLSLDDVPAGKPDPRPYLMAAKGLSLLPGDLLAVEDSPTGALSAHRAGLGIAYLGHREPDFAVTRIGALGDILALMPRIMERAHDL